MGLIIDVQAHPPNTKEELRVLNSCTHRYEARWAFVSLANAV